MRFIPLLLVVASVGFSATTRAAEDGYFRASETSEKSLAAEGEDAHSPAWQRVRANVESATSR